MPVIMGHWKLVLNKDFKHSTTRGHSQEPDTHRYTHRYLVWEATCPWDSLGTLSASVILLPWQVWKYLQNTPPNKSMLFPPSLKQHSHIFILTGIVLEIWSLRFTRIMQQKKSRTWTHRLQRRVPREFHKDWVSRKACPLGWRLGWKPGTDILLENSHLHSFQTQVLTILAWSSQPGPIPAPLKNDSPP